MIESFTFSALPKIIFGNGSFSRLPGLIKGYGPNAIIVTGKKSFRESSHNTFLLQEMDASGIKHKTIIIPGEPSPEMIDNAAEQLRSFNACVVVSIGGGSVLDAGKAISAMLTADGSVTEFLEDVGTKEHPGTKIPFIAVPTTSGTGSEATKNAVISKTGASGFKKSLRHDNFIPDIALVDPELTLNCPPEITAASGMDCFSQLVEAYLSTKASAFTDALAIEGLKAVKKSLFRSFLNGNNKEARAGMSFAALTSGICLANAGLGVVHGFASSIGGMYEIPHGLICGTLMGECNEATVRKLKASGSNPSAMIKYASLGQLFIDKQGMDNGYYVDVFIEFLNGMTEKLNLPCLKNAGVRKSDIPSICNATGVKNNPVKLDNRELESILIKRYN